MARGFDQQGAARDNRGNPAADGIHGKGEGQQ
jgi:hypothetical protein